jgi:hypothetical protein
MAVSTADSIEASANASGNRVSLALAESLRGELAGARGDVPAARRQFELARRILRDEGENDQLADLLLRQVVVERREGDAVDAARLAAQIADLQPSLEGAARFGAEALLARTDADAGRTASAHAHLGALGAEGERSPSLTRRIAFLAARAAVAAAEGREADAPRDLEAAIAAIVPVHRSLDLLDLRLDLAALTMRRDRALGIAAAREIAARSKALGLLGLAGRADRLVRGTGHGLIDRTTSQSIQRL